MRKCAVTPPELPTGYRQAIYRTLLAASWKDTFVPVPGANQHRGPWFSSMLEGIAVVLNSFVLEIQPIEDVCFSTGNVSAPEAAEAFHVAQ